MPRTVRATLFLLIVGALLALVCGLLQDDGAFLNSLSKMRFFDYFGLLLITIWLFCTMWLQLSIVCYRRPFNYGMMAIFSFALLSGGALFCLPFDIVRQFMWLNHATQTAWLIIASVNIFLIWEGIMLAWQDPGPKSPSIVDH